jgi:hypothetical protein
VRTTLLRQAKRTVRAAQRSANRHREEPLHGAVEFGWEPPLAHNTAAANTEAARTAAIALGIFPPTAHRQHRLQVRKQADRDAGSQCEPARSAKTTWLEQVKCAPAIFALAS